MRHLLAWRQGRSMRRWSLELGGLRRSNFGTGTGICRPSRRSHGASVGRSAYAWPQRLSRLDGSLLSSLTIVSRIRSRNGASQLSTCASRSAFCQ